MPVYSQGDPRQKIQLCAKCDEPTGSCEDDSLFVEDAAGEIIGPLCPGCYDAARSGSNPQEAGNG